MFLLSTWKFFHRDNGTINIGWKPLTDLSKIEGLRKGLFHAFFKDHEKSQSNFDSKVPYFI